MHRSWITAVSLALALAQTAGAQLPDVATILAEVGFDPAQIKQIEAGKFASATIKPSSDRELVAAFAFLVQESPADLVKEARSGLLDRIDANTLATR